MKIRLLGATLFLFSAIAGCKSAANLPTVTNSTNLKSVGHDYEVYGKKLELHSFEKVEKNEIENIDRIVEIFGEYFKNKYVSKSKPVERGVHPWQHGCVEGKLTINSNVPDDLQVGIFQPDRSYDVFIRYSNADPHLMGTDRSADSKGFAMKVLNAGDQLFPELGHSSQDFTLNSTDTFFSDTPEDYRRFMEVAFIGGHTTPQAIKKYLIDTAGRRELFKTHRILKAFLGIGGVKNDSLFDIDFYSITARAHGKGVDAPVVKYQVQRCDKRAKTTFDENSGDRFYKKNLIKAIESEETCLSFQIQRMPEVRRGLGGEKEVLKKKNILVEHLTKPWKQKHSPFVEVARISIPRQSLVDDKTCRSSVINPWNTLADHKPLGGINRLRLAAYLFSIEMRKKYSH